MAVLRTGSRGVEVRQLAVALHFLCYANLDTASMYFTKSLEGAVRRFQRAAGLKDDGVFGDRSRGALREEVRTIQRKLRQLGFYDGAIDGLVGPKTIVGTKGFQRSRKLVVDGRYGPVTSLRVNRDMAVIAQQRKPTEHLAVVRAVNAFLGFFKARAGGRRWSGIVVHHSATLAGGVVAFRKYHKSLGWSDIGYHWVIGNGTQEMRDGELGAGRPMTRAGGHTVGRNSTHLGVCVVGWFDNGRRMTDAQRKALIDVLEGMCRDFGISARAVIGHREAPAAKSCPGYMTDMNAIRSELSARLAR